MIGIYLLVLEDGATSLAIVSRSYSKNIKVKGFQESKIQGNVVSIHNSYLYLT